MKVIDAIRYIEDVIDKFSTEYYEPSEILARIQHETYTVLDTASRDLDNEVNWDLVNIFIKEIEITSETTTLNPAWLRIIEGYNLIDGIEYPAFRYRPKKRTRDPFSSPMNKYPVLKDVGGVVKFSPVQTGGLNKSFIKIIEKPIIGADEDDELISNSSNEKYLWVKYASNSSGAGMTDSISTYIGLSWNDTENESNNPADYKWSLYDQTKGISGEIKDNRNGVVTANQSLINRVLSSTIVSLVGSQFNQTLNYEWARTNKQEKAQEAPITQRSQQ